ncbi:glycosyltransferase [Haloferula sp. A504]|uniref:glycosyltransferase n=1 Tax=Haloferula sp. A504 TaxID=3373601 RepID=UPI0031BCE228|nr:hypothetical protein [Verrucomicrobiaceae bacterium E54]
MKWFTCTPVAFGGGEDFFCRDSGLLSRGFRAIGVESRAVMPGERKPEDLDELIRTDAANLESTSWWESHGLDGVVLYAWGRPKFRRVAEAIHRAGIRLVLNQDSRGMVSPRCGLKNWLASEKVVSGLGRVPGAWWKYAASVGRGLSVGLLATDPLRARHLRHGDRIAAVSPRAAEHYRALCRNYIGEDVGKRVCCIPHPVSPDFHPGDGTRERRVVAVGRWDDELQKRSSLLMATFERLLKKDAAVGIDLIGDTPDKFNEWRAHLPRDHGQRVTLHGRITPDRIVDLLQRARIIYCSSAFESFHIASAEGLCTGCTVVSSRSICLPSFEWFLSEGDGRFAETDDAAGHAAAIVDEMAAWDAGGRDPHDIAHRWAGRLHAPRVAQQVLGLFEDEDAGGKEGRIAGALR